jgi:hypothetical protein
MEEQTCGVADLVSGCPNPNPSPTSRREVSLSGLVLFREDDIGAHRG